MKFLVRDGVKLAYQDEGSGSPPMVLVHGWTCDHTYFAPQAEYFRKHHRVVSVDLRGHGSSDKPRQAYPISGFGDDLAFVCKELRLEKPVVVGHSMGGMIALDLAARYPDLASAIAACDSPIVVTKEMAARFAATQQMFRRPDWRTAQSQLLESMFIPADTPALKQRIIKEMSSAPEHVTVGCLEGLLSADTAAVAAKCRVPFLSIGAESPLTDYNRLRELCSTLVVGQTVGSGHFHQLEVPDQINAMIDRFLKISRLRSEN